MEGVRNKFSFDYDLSIFKCRTLPSRKLLAVLAKLPLEFFKEKGNVHENNLVYPNMRQILTLPLLLFSIALFGQTKGKLSLVIQALPELTFHKNDYGHRYTKKYTKATLNLGISSGIQYYVTNNLYLSVGLGYVPRQLKTKVFLNQGVIPPPLQIGSLELVTTKSLTYRTLFLPIQVGYAFLNKRKFTPFAICEFSGNYILNAKYDVNFDKYDGTYKKNYWHGYSLNIGLGSEYKISEKLNLVNSATYSVVNTVQQDAYLFSQDEYQIPLQHKYLKLSVGIKIFL